MNKKQILTTALVAVLLSSALAGVQFVRLAEANFMPIRTPQPAFIIKNDGSVNPSTAPIQRAGNIYTFTEDIAGYTIAVERNNIVLDGNGYTLQGKGNSTGVFIKNRNGVTVRNMEISSFSYGIRLIAEDYVGMSSSDNTLSGNTLTNNEYGIYIRASYNNVLRNNSMNNNKHNFMIRGGYLSDKKNGYTNDIDASNTVDRKPIIYWVNQQDRTVPSDAGCVALISCTNITVQNLNLANNRDGVLLVSTTDSTVTKNYVTNTVNGIYIYGSSSNTISENNITDNNNGIYAQDSSNNTISGNNVDNNQEGIVIQGSSDNNINRNTVNNNNETGINLYDSRGSDVIENTITANNGYGIRLRSDSSNNFVSENYIANNSIGILVDDSFDNKIIGNMITENSDWGMQLTGNQNNNMIYHNSFVNNNAKGEGLQVSIPSGRGNVWDNGTAGNYWSDYVTRYPNASEVGSSGVGDTPFYINENNIDRYPLMEPATIPEFPSCTPMLLPLIALIVALALYKWKLHKPKAAR
jgi:parallel beta-helix repeat protein